MTMAPEAHLLLALCIGLALAEPVAASCPPLSEADQRAIHQLAERYGRGWRENQRTTVLEVFTAEAVIMPDQGATLSGKAAIEGYYWPASGPATTILTFENRSLALAGCGDLAYDRGEYRLSFRVEGAAEAVTSRGEYLALAHRQSDGSWRWGLYTWNRVP